MKDIEFNYYKKLKFGYKDNLKKDLDRLKTNKILNGKSKKIKGIRSFLVSENMMKQLLEVLSLATVDTYAKLGKYIVANFPDFIDIRKRYYLFVFKVRGE